MTILGEAGKRYSEEEKKAAVQVAIEGGLSAAARASGADKASISRWLQAEGIDPSSVTKSNTTQQKRAAEASVASRRAALEEGKERLSRAFIAIAELSAAEQIGILQRTKDLPKGVRLSEVVGAGTRAVHDLQLLLGDNTEKVEYRPSTEEVMKMRDELAARRAAKQASGE